MKLLVIGKEGRLAHYTDASVLEKYEIAYVPIGSSDEKILENGADADFILVDAISTVSRNVIEKMPNLKMIHSEGVAFNKIDTDAAKDHGVYVCNCKGMNASAVAEQAILLMLGLLRGVATGDAAVRSGNQIKVKENYMLTGSLRELRDCTVGLVGFGDIARETALLAKAFGAKIVYNCRTPKSAEVEETYGANYMDLDSLLRESDIVSLHVPVTPATAGMVNEEFLSKMKEGSYLINTSRGELVEADALLSAIRSGHIAGAGLDTVTGEPITVDNPMLQAEDEVEKKILYSCHVGGITASSFARGYAMFWSDLDKVVRGERPDHIVNGM
ncbi:MAG: NAD(P)-dependent oxidoreductase [Lachnospiraceae bacterium]|nr:NAD(P)-dependent oxidoreductase [Lachnospiraceae bacterium]